MESEQVEKSIKQSITKNGFPDKVVRLPFKPVYDCCKKYGVVLSQILNNLKDEKIIGEIDGNHIVFRAPRKSMPRKRETAFGQGGNWDLSRLKEFANIENIQELAQDQLAKLSSEQLAEIRKMAENLTAEQKARILELFGQMNKPKP